MSTNPLFPDSDEAKSASDNAAVELIRAKVAKAYADEPDASQEIQEVKAVRAPSKHQIYMKELAASGKSLADIQTAWHHYYTTLTDDEKREVWAEFYEANQHTPYQKLFQKQQPIAARRQLQPAQPAVTLPEPVAPVALTGPVISNHEPAAKLPKRTLVGKGKKTAQLKQKIIKKVSANGRLQARHHVQSLLFGLGAGLVVICLFMFTFFNDVILAPFIQPSRNVSATPIIVGDTAQASGTPQVIIPKINVQIPLDLTLTSNDESVIENALEDGVVHYPSTVLPGQVGNAAVFGHSSNNIFNPGKYKFAFVLLHTLTTGDVFYITYNGTVYAYQVFAREIVPPNQVSVLYDTKGKTATATLITCDPPGTSNNRLVVWGEQISPSPSGNTAAQPAANTTQPSQLASNGPSLWSRFVDTLEFWN